MVIEDNRPPSAWPARDSQNPIVVAGLAVKYTRGLPSVLQRAVSASACSAVPGAANRRSRERPALVDPSESRIRIKGMNITTIGPHDLHLHATRSCALLWESAGLHGTLWYVEHLASIPLP